eukprot:3777955-Amphidinium_carterae.3
MEVSENDAGEDDARPLTALQTMPKSASSTVPTPASAATGWTRKSDDQPKWVHNKIHSDWHHPSTAPPITPDVPEERASGSMTRAESLTQSIGLATRGAQ